MTLTSTILLQTERLYIFPLTHAQLVQYLETNKVLEQSLGLNAHPRRLSPELVEAFEETILAAVANLRNNYLFSTLWTVVLKDKKIMVGDLCFKGEPNDRGEVEIGYGTYNDFQGTGYMTEAVKALTDWAFQQPAIKLILAETDENNVASHRTLQKNNFERFARQNDMLWWRLYKS
ncbi:MAG TPA: GNAT family N-acetyltransferase [Flavisolibacter sp.]|nr:GNAT family N-acetyltransferase [Flavisolibacter sp.]